MSTAAGSSSAAAKRQSRPGAGRVVVLSGPSGSGKTTTCRALAAASRRRGLLVTGVLTLLQPTAPNAERWVEDLRSAQRRLLAREGPPGADGLRWHFREDVLAWADGVLAAACPTDVLIVDELGPLELIHGAGWWRGATLALRGAFELAIVAVRPALVDRFVDRMTTDHAHVDAVIAPPAGEQWLEQWVEAKERRADPGVSH